MASTPESLTSRGRGKLGKSFSLTLQLQRLLSRASVAVCEARSVQFEALENLRDFVVGSAAQFAPAEGLAEALTKAAVLFEATGDHDVAWIASSKAVEHAARSKQTHWLIRAHTAAGIACVRLANIDHAVAHLADALRLAVDSADKTGEIEARIGVVALLECTGSTRAALDLCLGLIGAPRPGAVDTDRDHELAVLGMNLALAVGDRAQASRLHDRSASRATGMAGSAVDRHHPGIDCAFETGRIRYLIETDRLEDAATALAEARTKWSASGNSRSRVLVGIAEARLEIARPRPGGLRRCRNALRRALRQAANEPVLVEQILDALVRLYRADPSAHAMTPARALLRSLRDHVVHRQHAAFFSRSQADVSKGESAEALGDPVHPGLDDLVGASTLGRIVPRNDRLDALVDACASAEDGSLRDRRTAAYARAENWAIAAELRAKPSSAHCVEVGATARAIAEVMGLEEGRCAVIEFACRVHDLGKVAVEESVLRETDRGMVDEYRSILEHTTAGDRLLAGSDDPILVVARRVARSHHEWWNGSGYPDGLRGEHIPVEARICAIADVYVKLRRPPSGAQAWSHDQAIRQIRTMGGVQVDPTIAERLVRLDGRRIFESARGYRTFETEEA